MHGEKALGPSDLREHPLSNGGRRTGHDLGGELNSTLVAKDRAGPYKRFVRKEVRGGVLKPDADQLFHVLVRLKKSENPLEHSNARYVLRQI